ncbi:hypothetical protein [Enterovibrio coralii]|nr:hypothetical protein [Enterovibrio coralii]
MQSITLPAFFTNVHKGIQEVARLIDERNIDKLVNVINEMITNNLTSNGFVDFSFCCGEEYTPSIANEATRILKQQYEKLSWNISISLTNKNKCIQIVIQ